MARRLRRVIQAGVLVGVGLVLHATLIERYWIEVTHHAVALPVGPRLRIVHLADLHTVGRGRLERRMLALVKALHPDLIVITGDIVANGSLGLGVAEAAGVRSVVAELHAPLGVLAVAGNWEHFRGLSEVEALLRGTAVRLLRNEAVEVRHGLFVVGLDDAWAGQPDEAAAFRGVPAGAVTIALLHSPAPFPSVAGRAALVFAGHSHGGQLRIPLLPPLWLPPETNGYIAGWYGEGASRMYVSRGVGTSVLPARLFCRPEIAVIDVEGPSS
jgi:predicted MPP superfamily phosphohydrolase